MVDDGQIMERKETDKKTWREGEGRCGGEYEGQDIEGG